MQKLTRNEFVGKHLNTVLNLTKNSGIFPETVFTIAIVESQDEDEKGNYFPGLGDLAQTANNYFGIKADASWRGKTITLNTPGDSKKVSKFRAYNSFSESAKDFIKFLQVNPRYKAAGVFNAKNHVEQLVSIAKAGYAENPSYSNLLLSVASKFKQLIKSGEEKRKPVVLFTFALSLIAILYIIHNGKVSRKI